MSGTKKMHQGWGGRREGSGRKPGYMLSENQVKAMLNRMRKAKRQLGIDENDFLISIITEGRTPNKKPDKATIRERLAAVKLFKEFSAMKTSKQEIDVTRHEGPAIVLPEMLEDPALKIIGGGKDDS